MRKWNKLKEIMDKADKNPYLLASFHPKDILKLMESIEEENIVYKVTDIKDNVYYCRPSTLNGYMVYNCPCGRIQHLNIEWCFHRGFEYCSKCQNVIWEAKIITEVLESEIEEDKIDKVNIMELL